MKVILKPLYFLLCPIYSIKDYPIMYRGKDFTLLYYGIFQAAGAMSFFVTSFYYLLLKGFQITPKMLFLSIAFPLLTWLGAKLFYYFVWLKYLIKNPKKYLFETGFSVHGAIIGGIIACFLFSTICNIELLLVTDAASIGALICIFFGRLGCYNYGCCYGTPTSVPWAIAYTNMDSKILRINPNMKGVRIHPVQLYSAGLCLIVFITIICFLPSGSTNGIITAIFIMFHGLKRISLEKFRYDLYKGNERNKKTFYTALVLACVGFFLMGKIIITQGKFNASFRVMQASLKTFYSLFQIYPSITIFMVASGILAFIGYGIHGKVLGTFPFFKL
jgi:prolipoprotein diacylglyceryltransferase